MRNSKVLTPEEMQKLREYGKRPKKGQNHFVTTIHKNLAKLDGVNLKKNNLSSMDLVNNAKEDENNQEENKEESSNSSASPNSDDKYSIDKNEKVSVTPGEKVKDSLIKKTTHNSIIKTPMSPKSPVSQPRKKKLTLNENALFDK